MNMQRLKVEFLKSSSVAYRIFSGCGGGGGGGGGGDESQCSPLPLYASL